MVDSAGHLARMTHCKVLTLHPIAFVQQVFFAATGVSDGDLLRGVRYFSGGASTNSIVMRASSGTGKPSRLALGNYQGLLRRLHKEGTCTC